MADGDILRIPHGTAAQLATITPSDAEILFDDTNKELRYGDSATAGGITLARKTHTHLASEIASGTLDGDRLPAMSATKQGAVPATGGETTTFLRADGAWATPAGGASGNVTNGDAHDHSRGDGNPITETALLLSNVTICNATPTRHGFLPKLNNNASMFLNGQGAWATPSSGGGKELDWFNVKDYGAVADFNGSTGTDNTTAFQNALAAVAANGGGILYIPAGKYLVPALELPNKCWLRGAGMRATYLYLKNGANNARGMIYNHVSTSTSDANATFCAVTDMTLDCNAGNQTQGDGIDFDRSPQWGSLGGRPDDNFDPHHLVENVWIQYCKGTGVDCNGQNESRIINVHVKQSQGYGFELGSDGFMVSCTAEGTYLAGFKPGGSSSRLVGCKAFGCGLQAADKSQGHGFFYDNDQGGLSMVNCEAQDCSAYGFYLTGRRITMKGCVSDSNNRGETAGLYGGVYISGIEDSEIDCICWERAMDTTGNRQQYGLVFGSGTNKNSRVWLTCSTYQVADITPLTVTAIKPGTFPTTGGIAVIVGTGEGSFANYTPAAGDTVTPDPYNAHHNRISLPAGTATVTIANPANEHPGCVMRVTVIQNADGPTGKTVTWGSKYKFKDGASNAAGTNASKWSTYDLQFDGTYWAEVSRSYNTG